MEKLFPGSYRPSPETLEQMWREATIAVDANVLLHIYRYSATTRDQLLDALEKVQDRLWVPYQAVEEFHRNREEVIGDQQRTIRLIRAAFDALVKELGKHTRHPTLDLDRLQRIANRASNQAAKMLDEAEVERIDVVADQLLRRLTEIIGDRIGDQPSSEVLENRLKEGQERYDKNIPPGYKDKDKDEPERFGDYLLWRELLDHAEKRRQPVILVTDDQKEDWWLEQNGKRIGPRRELIDEMATFAGVSLHLYTPDRFITYAQKNLGITEDSEVIEEVQEVSRSAAQQGSTRIPGIPSGAATAWESMTGGTVASRESLEAALQKWEHAADSNAAQSRINQILANMSPEQIERVLRPGISWEALQHSMADSHRRSTTIPILDWNTPVEQQLSRRQVDATKSPGEGPEPTDESNGDDSET